MPTTPRPVPLPTLATHCQSVLALTREELLGVAVARGCRHYAAFVPQTFVVDRPRIEHEVLGCALLAGEPSVETFRAIRVGAMVLSDAGNTPEVMATVAQEIGVGPRLAHIAHIASNADDHPDFWHTVLELLPGGSTVPADDFLPTVSRFCAESRMTGHGRGASRVWLRTEYNKR